MNFSTAIKQSNTDEWYTPKENVEIIVPFIHANGYKKILCPFDKEESQFVQVFKRVGLAVTYSHIETGTDFFDLDLSEYDAIVSNPPFSKRERILEKLFASGKPFAMILNFNGLFDSKTRWELFKRYEFELIVPLGRMRFFNEDCEGNSPNFQSIYVCHGMAKEQIVFTKGDEKVKQYCRYCVYMCCGNGNYCSVHKKTFSDAYIKAVNNCSDFDFCKYDALGGNVYKPRKEKDAAGDQLSLF